MEPTKPSYQPQPFESPPLSPLKTETQIFKASAPTLTLKQKCLRSAKLALKVIAFPITLPAMGLAKLAVFIGVQGKNSHALSPVARSELALIANSQKVQFKTSDNVLLEGMIFKGNPNKKTILIHSGSHLSHEFYTPPMVNALLEMGHTVMVYNYRGFGNSQGKPSEKGLYLDAEAAYQYLTKVEQIPPNKIVNWGYSLGGGPAAELAAKHGGDLILDRSFSSMTSVSENTAKRFGKISSLLAKVMFKLGADFNNLKKIDQLTGKIFIVREKVSHSMTEKDLATLSQRFIKTHPKENITIETLPIPHMHTTETLWFGKINPETINARQDLIQFLS